jgi:hypothetical protein
MLVLHQNLSVLAATFRVFGPADRDLNGRFLSGVRVGVFPVVLDFPLILMMDNEVLVDWHLLSLVQLQ